MMGRQDRDQGQLFYEFKLDDAIPNDHLLRRMNVFVSAALADLHQQLRPFYSDIGRPSVDPARSFLFLTSRERLVRLSADYCIVRKLRYQARQMVLGMRVVQ